MGKSYQNSNQEISDRK